MTVHDLLEQTDNFDGLLQQDQVKLIAYFHCVEFSKTYFQTKDIKHEFERQRLKPPSSITSLIPKMRKCRPPVFVLTKDGNALSRFTKKELDEEFLGQSHKKAVSLSLRNLVPELNGYQQKTFLEEAICCFEIKSFRASILMTWLLTIDTLFEYVLIAPNLMAFNEAIQKHGKYRKIVVSNKEDFSEIKESDFIEILRVSKLISNDSRKILIEKLGIRNSCAHPNTIIIEDYKAIGFIQDLVINIISKIC